MSRIGTFPSALPEPAEKIAAPPELASGMTTLPSCGALASFIEHSPFRWPVLSLAVAAVIATAAYSYREIDKELTALTLSRREAVAQLMAATLTEKFGRAMDIAISLSTRVHFRELVAAGRWDEAFRVMQSVPQDLPHIDRLFLVDLKGTLKADVPALPGARGVKLASLDWFREVSRNWQPYVSAAHTMWQPRQSRFLRSPCRSKARQGKLRASWFCISVSKTD